MDLNSLPVAIIGAGPIGLAAAAQLAARGARFVVLEAGESVGASVLAWGHVRVFSPWRYDVDPVAVRLLEASGWLAPDEDAHPTGRDLVERYLRPLAALPLIRPHVRTGARVLGVSRSGIDRMKSAVRERSPFVLRIEERGGEHDLLARAVIDASGTFGSPNPLGANGLPARGEAAARDRIRYGAPDILGSERARFAGRRVLVAGSGHTALGALLELAALRVAEPATRVDWVVRQPAIDRAFGGGDSDQLPERGRLGERVRTLVAEGALRIHTGFRISSVRSTEDGLVVASEDAELPPVDEVIAATGFRPDLSILREVRLDLDAVVESPAALAPLIDPNHHSCGTVPPHGFEQLRHPERDFYVVGMKSYGRAPTFLMLTGYEQVRSVVAALTGDLEAALQVSLRLPETGVCSSGPGEAASCCAPAPEASVSGAGGGCC